MSLSPAEMLAVIDQAKAEILALREALEPFVVAYIKGGEPHIGLSDTERRTITVTLGDLREAGELIGRPLSGSPELGVAMNLLGLADGILRDRDRGRR